MTEPARYVAYYRMPAAGAAQRAEFLARQRTAIETFLAATGRSLVGEFTEIIGSMDRGGQAPLGLAIECCRGHRATLIAAVPEGAPGDAARRAAESAGVEIVLIDAASEHAGAPPETGDVPYLPLGRRRPAPRPPLGNRQKADAFARAILPVIEQIRASGATSLTAIAEELNAREVRTARGRRWHPTTVRNILTRAHRSAEDA